MKSRRRFLTDASLAAAAVWLTQWSELSAADLKPTGQKVLSSRKLFPYFKSTPVSYLHVRMQDAFWASRQQTTRDVSVQWITSGHDAAGGLEAFEQSPETYKTKVHTDEPEHIKFIEAMASVLGVAPDDALEAFIDTWAVPLMAGQGRTGYLLENAPVSRYRPQPRWQAGWWSHEDFLVGHYIEAAIAYKEATGRDSMYASAVRAADNMVAELLNSSHAYAPAHPEIEHALMRLYGVTGNTDYLRLCEWLLQQRGRHEGRASYGRFMQDHLPVKEQRTIEGHAVRAAFLFNAVTECVGATGDAGYREAALAVWDDLVGRKLYLHGVGGNISSRAEGYRENPYCILPDDAFGESCSVFANIQWAHSLFRLTGHAKYIDVAERMLCNAFYASLSLAGDSSFYANVAQTGFYLPADLPDVPHPPVARSKAWATSCCPPNIVKLFNTLGGYFYSTDDNGIYVKHYGSSAADISWGNGVKLTQRTEYPWSGAIMLQVEPKKSQRFALRLRIPSWAKSYVAKINGVHVESVVRDGWLAISRRWNAGDQVELILPMQIERVRMPPQFKEYEQLVALQRGPIVYCLEQQDLERPQGIYCAYLPEDAQLIAEHRPEFLGGVTVLRGKLGCSELIGVEGPPVEAMFVPYGVWGNRKIGAMRIWLNASRAHPYESIQPDLRLGVSCIA